MSSYSFLHVTFNAYTSLGIDYCISAAVLEPKFPGGD